MPRAGLSPAAVVDAALAVVDEQGAAALTLANVAARTGVATPSLYKHVESLADLHRSVRLRATAELGEHLARAVDGKTGEPGIRALARAYRGFVHRFPHRFAFHQTPPDPADVEGTALANSVIALVVGVLEPYALTGDQPIHAARCLRAAVQGFAGLEVAEGFGLPLETDVSFEHLIAMLVAGVAAMSTTAVAETDGGAQPVIAATRARGRSQSSAGL